MEIKTLNIIAGSLPARIRGLVEEWAELNQDGLMSMWQSQEFHPLKPLI